MIPPLPPQGRRGFCHVRFSPTPGKGSSGGMNGVAPRIPCHYPSPNSCRHSSSSCHPSKDSYGREDSSHPPLHLPFPYYCPMVSIYFPNTSGHGYAGSSALGAERASYTFATEFSQHSTFTPKSVSHFLPKKTAAEV